MNEIIMPDKPQVAGANGAPAAPPPPIDIILRVHANGKMDITGPFEQKKWFVKILTEAINTVMAWKPEPVSPWSMARKLFKGRR